MEMRETPVKSFHNPNYNKLQTHARFHQVRLMDNCSSYLDRGRVKSYSQKKNHICPIGRDIDKDDV